MEEKHSRGGNVDNKLSFIRRKQAAFVKDVSDRIQATMQEYMALHMTRIAKDLADDLCRLRETFVNKVADGRHSTSLISECVMVCRLLPMLRTG